MCRHAENRAGVKKHLLDRNKVRKIIQRAKRVNALTSSIENRVFYFFLFEIFHFFYTIDYHEVNDDSSVNNLF